MSKSSNQKLKLIYLMKILLERTDETHSITMPEIIDALAAYDISAERKSLYNSIRVNTDQVAQIASNIEGLNKRLTEELTNSKATIDQLANVWEGEAAQATISSFDEFAAKYFQNYEDIITQYVQFLRTNIEQGYFDTETQNIGLADAFK